MKYKWELRETVGLFGFLLVLATLYFGLIYTGPAKFFTAPNAQKLFYFHVPSGLVTYLAFLMVVGGSALYLYNQSHYADRVAKCSAELGIVFGFMSLASGTFWMKAEWGGDIVSRFLTMVRSRSACAMASCTASGVCPVISETSSGVAFAFFSRIVRISFIALASSCAMRWLFHRYMLLAI